MCVRGAGDVGRPGKRLTLCKSGLAGLVIGLTVLPTLAFPGFPAAAVARVSYSG